MTIRAIYTITTGAPSRGLDAIAALLIRLDADTRVLRTEAEQGHPDRSTDRQDQDHACRALLTQLERSA